MKIRLLASLALLVGLGVVAGELGDDSAISFVSSRAILSVGVLMIGAWLVGMLFEAIHLPKICGFLLFGLMMGPSLLGVVSGDQIKADPGEVPPLKFINDLAVALIALLAGGEIKLKWLFERARRMSLLLLSETAFTFCLMGGAVYLAAPWIPFMKDISATERWVIAILAAVVMISNSPAVIIAMLTDYRAKGAFSQTLLGFAVCKDLILIVMFAASLSLSRGLLNPEVGINAGFILAIGVQLIGSIVVGLLLGAVMAWYVHRVRAHLIVFIIGSCLIMAFIGEISFTIAGQSIHLETLLMALSAGLLCQNLWPDASEPLFATLEDVSLPVYCLFFAYAGAKIDLSALQMVWYIAAAMVLARAGAIWVGMRAGCGLAGINEPWSRRLWLGMIPQAGVSLVLITLIERTFSDTTWSVGLTEMLIGMVVVHETIGPIGLRHALLKSGETHAAS